MVNNNLIHKDYTSILLFIFKAIKYLYENNNSKNNALKIQIFMFKRKLFMIIYLLFIYYLYLYYLFK